MMSGDDLQVRIFDLCYTLEVTTQVIITGLKNIKADKQLIASLIDYQLETYGELRLLLRQCEQANDSHMDCYDSLLHQLRTDYLLLEHGIFRRTTSDPVD